MSESDFLSCASSVLGVSGLSLETRFRELPGWCSMLGFGLLVMLENECGSAPDVDTFLKIDTLGELYRRFAERKCFSVP